MEIKLNNAIDVSVNSLTISCNWMGQNEDMCDCGLNMLTFYQIIVLFLVGVILKYEQVHEETYCFESQLFFVDRGI